MSVTRTPDVVSRDNTACATSHNDLVTLTRGFTTSFAGISLPGVPMVIVAQIAGALCALAAAALLFPVIKPSSLDTNQGTQPTELP